MDEQLALPARTLMPKLLPFEQPMRAPGSDFNQTTFLECHGTGTQAGDANEVSGAAAVFSATRSADRPLIIGSIKSNIGHSEPAAGLSRLMKAVMSIEKGAIPGNPTFITQKIFS